MPPLVSILIPVYNRETLVAEALDSALNQTHAELEVVAVDNHSTDATWQQLRRYAARDRRVRIFRNPRNLGPVANWLRCVEEARGSYGKILWSDDRLDPRFIERTLPWLENHPGAGFAYTGVEVFGEALAAPRLLYSSEPAGLRPSSLFIERALLDGPVQVPVSPGNALFRMESLRHNLLRQIPNRLGLDFSSLAVGNDLLLYLLTAASCEHYAVIPEPLALFRAHADSITISSDGFELQLLYHVARAWFVESHPLPAALRRRFNARLLELCLKNRSGRLGLRRVRDFYPHEENPPVDLIHFAARMIAAGARRACRAAGRRDRGGS